MALIKQANAGDLARHAIVLDLGDLQRQGAAIMSQARQQAEAMVADAKKERERILAGAAEAGRAEGFEVGRAAGHKQGMEAGRVAALAEVKERLTKLDAAWSKGLTEFESARDGLLRDAQTDVLRLAVRVAERVTKRKVTLDPAVAASQLAAVLAVIVRPSRLSVRIHPDDRSTLEAALPRLLAQFAAARHIELVDDQTLSVGSCIASTSAAGREAAGGQPQDRNVGGEIDASIDTQLARIVEVLLPGESVSEAPPAAEGDAP